MIIYDVREIPPFKNLLVFGMQLVLSVFVATVLIANIVGVSSDGVLVGVGIATLMYLIATEFKVPMFMSSSGALVTPVMFALAVGGYTSVAIGGIVSCIIYTAFGMIFLKVDVDKIYEFFPKALIGAVTVVIGANLMQFVPSYVQINGEENFYGLLIAFVTMISVACISHYAKSIWKILPFLGGTLIGYALSLILTVTGVCNVIQLDKLKSVSLFSMPDVACMHWETINWSALPSVIILFAAFTLSAIMECLSDHAVLGEIIEKDLYRDPGLSRIFVGEGVANMIGACIGGVGICSYGEGVACVGFSKVASTAVTVTAAIMIIILGFLSPVQAFISSIPNCVFGGCAIILYGYIASSGIKTLQKTDINNTKNLIIVSSTMVVGVSGLGLSFGNFVLSGTALALIVGVILNLVLKEKKRA